MQRPDGTFDHRGVFIPPGVAHGFAALSDMVITYLVDGYYNPNDELGVAWNDPAIDADWGVTDPTLSSRDQQNPGRADGRPRPATTGVCALERAPILVTGGAGFIGSNYVRHVLATTDDTVTVYDALDVRRQPLDAARRRRRPAVPVREGQHLDPETLEDAMRGHDAVVHFAAESHVDRSIVGPDDFVHTNCFGTNVVMDTARRLEILGSCTSAPTRCTARSRSDRRGRPIRSNPARRTRRRRRAPISSPSRTTTPTACR